MSTPINQIRSRMTGSSNGGGIGNSQMMYDPTPPHQIPDPSQLSTTFPMPPQMPSNDNNGMLEDILREMERSGTQDSGAIDANVGSINYAINPVNIPPPMSPQTQMQLQSEATHAAAPMHMIEEAHTNISGGNSSTMLGELTGSALGQKILISIKPLVYVFVIVFVLSLHQTNRFIFSFFPQLLLENGQLSIFAILLRCTIAVILFYAANLIF